MSPERRVPKDHPLRTIWALAESVLEDLSPRFSEMYSHTGRPSIAPEKLLRALLLQILYSIRSERLLMEQLDYNLLFRWFVGLNMDDPVWDATVFTKNRDRLLAGDVAQAFFEGVLARARKHRLLSDEHFTVDGTLVEAWASHKSFQRKDQSPSDPDDPSNPNVDFRGQKRRNDTHESKTDPDSRLWRKTQGREAHLCYMGHVLMDNRHGLVVNTRLSTASGRAEREAALEMVKGRRGGTLGADKAYDAREFVRALRETGITPHVAQRLSQPKRSSAIDARTTRHPGYHLSQRTRKRVEEIFGWMKTIGLLRQTRHRGRTRVGWMFTFTAAVYNLVRIRNLLTVPT